MCHRQIILLLTATIIPGATPFVARVDPEVRLQDYRTALTKWALNGGYTRLIVCENSGADLSALEEVVRSLNRDNVEFISYVDIDSSVNRGKGYAELLEIQRALNGSTRIAPKDVIVKCTGRLTAANGASLFGRMRELEFDVMCDLRKYLTVADSRIFAATREFLEDYLIPRREMIDDRAGMYMEHALARAAMTAVANGKTWRPFPVYPEISGISGSTGRSMTDSPMKRLAKRVYYRLIDRVYRR